AYTRGAEVGLLVARQQRKPLCVTDHGDETSPLVRHLGALDLADLVIASSDFAGSLYRTSAPVTVVKGGVDSSRFTPPERPVTRDRVLFVGPILPREGVDRLIEALPTGLPLTVCGPAPHEDYLGRLRALGRDKAVEFVTDADPLLSVDLYRRAWATVVPAVRVDCYGKPHEAAGLSSLPLLESLACGTPTLASRLGALPEFVVDGETGFLFDDPDGLTERLRRLATDPGLAERMGQRGRLLVEREFADRVAGSRLFELYAGLTGLGSGSESEAAA
ncbi:MAG: glycosyltransferase family 4 protein, partial [Planctomycetia bacterium]|nr:glycosyltransferase family 4 protein [Planctomycetia bacterium]